MQATAGVPLADLPAMMEHLGRGVPGETAEQATEREPARTLITPTSYDGKLQQVQASAPAMARDVIAALHTERGYAAALHGDTASLTGFLAALLMCVKLLQGRQRPVKYNVTLLPRTSFATMVEALPDAQQQAIQTHSRLLVDRLLDVANRTVLLPHSLDANLRPDSPLIAAPALAPGRSPSSAQTALSRLTIEDWVTGVAHGHDYLVPAEMDRWLTEQHHTDRATRREVTRQLESFGSAPHLDTRGTTKLALFENRAIAPLGDGVNLSLYQAATNAQALLRFFRDLRQANQAHHR